MGGGTNFGVSGFLTGGVSILGGSGVGGLIFFSGILFFISGAGGSLKGGSGYSFLGSNSGTS